jgi:hypothetical protein
VGLILRGQNRSRRPEQPADGGRQEQAADFPFLICHFSYFSFVILVFQAQDDHEERGITMKNDQ